MTFLFDLSWIEKAVLCLTKFCLNTGIPSNNTLLHTKKISRHSLKERAKAKVSESRETKSDYFVWFYS